MKKYPRNIHVQRSLPNPAAGITSEICKIFSPELEGQARVFKWTMQKGHHFDVIPDPYDSYFLLYVIHGSLKLLNNGTVLGEDESLVVNNSPDYCTVRALNNTKILFVSQGDYALDKSYGVHSNLLEEYVFKINEIDHYTYGHSQRVKYTSLDLALYLNRPDVTLSALYYASLYHDAGKINIPERVLNFPGRLDPDQLDYTRRHPIDSFNLIKDIMDPLTSEIVLQHHERLDGSGYPSGLKSVDILTEAKIIAICDSFDAIRNKRVYSADHTVEESLAILRQDTDRLYDREIFEAFEEMVSDDQYLWPPIPIEYAIDFKAPIIRSVKSFGEDRRSEPR